MSGDATFPWVVPTQSGYMLARQIDERLRNEYLPKRYGNSAIPESLIVPVEVTTFADSDIKTVIDQHVRGENLFLIADVRSGTTLTPREPQPSYRSRLTPLAYEVHVRNAPVETRMTRRTIAEEFDSLCSALEAARYAVDRGSVTVVLPYFPSARQDRREARESLDLQRRIIVLEELGADRVMTIDMHNPAAASFRQAKFDNLKAQYTLQRHIEESMEEKGPLLFVSPDTGKLAVKQARTFLEKFGGHFGTIYKMRSEDRPNELAESLGYLGDTAHIAGSHVYLIDDMIDTGGSVVSAAEFLRANGAASVRAVATHGALSGHALTRFSEAYRSGTVREVIVTNSISMDPAVHGENEWLTLVPIERYFAKAITRLHHNESLSKLLE